MSEEGSSMSERAPFLTPVYCPGCYGGTMIAWYVEVGQQVGTGATLGTMTNGQCRTIMGIPVYTPEEEERIIAPYSGRVASLLKHPGEAVHSGMALLLLAETRGMNEKNKGKPFGHYLIHWDLDDGKRRKVWKDDGGRRIVEALGISGTTIWHWWAGSEHPTDEQLVAIAVHLGVSEEELEAARVAIATIPPITVPRQSEDLKP